MSLRRFVVVDRGDGVGECEVLLGGMIFPGDAFFDQSVLVVEHFVNARLANIPSFGFFAIDGVAEIFVVRRDGLGNRAGCAPARKSALRLLARLRFLQTCRRGPG